MQKGGPTILERSHCFILFYIYGYLVSFRAQLYTQSLNNVQGTSMCTPPEFLVDVQYLWAGDFPIMNRCPGVHFWNMNIFLNYEYYIYIYIYVFSTYIIHIYIYISIYYILGNSQTFHRHATARPCTTFGGAAAAACKRLPMLGGYFGVFLGFVFPCYSWKKILKCQWTLKIFLQV